VEILQYHLAEDGAPAMRPTRQVEVPQSLSTSESLEQQQQQQQQEQQKQQGPLPPDKIIVYANFPSAFGLIGAVSDCI